SIYKPHAYGEWRAIKGAVIAGGIWNSAHALTVIQLASAKKGGSLCGICQPSALWRLLWLLETGQYSGSKPLICKIPGIGTSFDGPIHISTGMVCSSCEETL